MPPPLGTQQSPGKRIHESYLFCRRITLKNARNFFYSLLLLPQPKRQALYMMYAFMRYSDDLVDAPHSGNKAEELLAWRRSLEKALQGEEADCPIFPAFVETVNRYAIPVSYFFELLDGMQMDLEKSRYQTFEELYPYCYRVASVVGLVCVHIFGFRSPQALRCAESMGIAFQLTNILRDIREDCAGNRVYLPLEDLEKFHYSEEKLKQNVMDESFRQLVAFEVNRARRYYQEAEQLIPLIEPDCRKALSALLATYRSLLKKISREQRSLFEKRIRLSPWEKLGIIFQAWKNPTALLEAR